MARTIFTETEPRDEGDAIPDHTVVDVADDLPASEFARIGREVGLKCRSDFELTYHRGSNADSRLFFQMLGNAVSDALRRMRRGGSAEEKVAAWRDAFWEGMAPSDEELKLISIVDGNP